MLDSWQSPVLIGAAVALLALDLVVLRPRGMRGAARLLGMHSIAAVLGTAALASLRHPTIREEPC